jgi:hypothetical protein
MLKRQVITIPTGVTRAKRLTGGAWRVRGTRAGAAALVLGLAVVIPRAAEAKGRVPVLTMCGASGCREGPGSLDMFERTMVSPLLTRAPARAPFVVLRQSGQCPRFVYVPSRRAALLVWCAGAGLPPAWHRLWSHAHLLRTNVEAFPAPRHWTTALAAARRPPPRAVLYQGVHLGPFHHVLRFSDARSRQIGDHKYASWRGAVQARARYAYGPFRNLPPSMLRRRLARLATRYHFTVVSLTLRRPRQLAPRVVVRTTHYVELARATWRILRRIDPRPRNGDDPRGWRYEGFFFEAVDEEGVPFLLAYDFMRGPGGGGGAWARSDAVSPFLHG